MNLFRNLGTSSPHKDSDRRRDQPSLVSLNEIWEDAQAEMSLRWEHMPLCFAVRRLQFLSAREKMAWFKLAPIVAVDKCKPGLLLRSHSHNDVPPNLSGTYPWPQYEAPCLPPLQARKSSSKPFTTCTCMSIADRPRPFRRIEAYL